MMNYYREKQIQSIRDSRRELIKDGVCPCYIHVLSANACHDGLGAVYPYDESIYDDMNILYIPFVLMYTCVDIKDLSTIRQYLADTTISTEEICKMEKNAVSKYNDMDSSSSSLWSNIKSFLFDDNNMDVLRYY